MGPVHLHDLLVHLFFIIFIFFPYFLHFWLKFLHCLHGDIALMGEGPEKNLNEQG